MENEWDVINNFFLENSLVQHHIDSFNEFLDISLLTILKEYECVNIGEFSNITLKNMQLHKPNHIEHDRTCTHIKPPESRLRNLTYSSNLVVDITIIIKGDTTVFANVLLCKLPIMVRSNLCNTLVSDEDIGGYFIINGSEKVLISQEKMTNNKFFVFEKRHPMKYSHIGEFRCVKENELRSSNTMFLYVTTMNIKREQFIRLQLTSMRGDISIFHMFFILGYETKEEILDCFKNESDKVKQFIQASMIEFNTTTRCESIKAFSSKMMTNDNVEKVVISDFAYTSETIANKKIMLKYMVIKLINCCLGNTLEDDRDHFKNKRIELAGHLYTNLFRQLFRRTYKEFINNTTKFVLNSKILNIQNMYKSKIVSNGLRYSLSTGNWGVGGNSFSKNGISQVYNRLTFMSSISHMRRINSPIGRDGKVTSPRHLHNSHWGKVCPAETPEGATCGLVKNMALLAMVTVYCDSAPVKNIIDHITKNCSSISDVEYIVFINGIIYTQTLHHSEIYKEIKKKKLSNGLSPCVGVCLDEDNKEIRLFTDGGRICRPLYVVNQLTGALTIVEDVVDVKITPFSHLVENGYIEYIDCEEEEFTLISPSVKDMSESQEMFTHCEIHPATILGTSASSIPFADHNQSPRNTYQSAMGKQSIGIPTMDYQNRMDTISHVLCYPQKPLVYTNTGDIIGLSDMPSGQNAIVAIASYTGYNQEDSIIMNKGAIDRGLFRSIFYKTYKEETKIHGSGTKETIEVPDPNECIDIKLAHYDKLGIDGVVETGQTINGNDVIIGKTIMTPDLNGKKRDCSTIVRVADNGIVDKVMMTTNEIGSSLLKIRVRKTKIPQIGDKFSARHGQKGTIGMIYNEEDMPFSGKDGIRPDIIINPHAIPSRMTVGQLLESVFGKVATLDGKCRDSTAFAHDETEIHDVYQSLHKFGFNRHGSDMLINGMTGKQMQYAIFIGPTYYQRLKHMVDDKIHSRGKGPVQILTRQPVEGRARDGGLRTGEMERDAMISHGSSLFMKDRLFYNSDAYRVHVCTLCGLIVTGDIKNKCFFCKSCCSPKVKQITLPFATKLLFQELMSIGATPRIF